jgi:hypothetical protein
MPARSSSAGIGPTDMDIVEHVSCSRSVFNWCVDRVEQACHDRRYSEAVVAAGAAAQSATSVGLFGDLVSPRLEAALIRVAETLPPFPLHVHGQGGNKQRWLHVLNTAYPFGGHTKNCAVWIESDPDLLHNVVLLDQRTEIPPRLANAVTSGGGTVKCLDYTQSLLQRAHDLRQYAASHADVVVLHRHPEDVIAPIAFGVFGGPPVVLVNHADHLFWAGVSIVDFVADLRDSGHQWTREHRGMSRADIVPIPLRSSSGEDVESTTEQQKEEARKALRLPTDYTILLTIGSRYKYVPSGGLDFIAAARSILSRRPNVILVAVGPEHTGAWRQVSESTGGRLRAMGEQRDVSVYHRAADLYIEGFPMGSMTALLEAGLAGVPCVRAPSMYPSPVTSDGIALADLEQPCNIDRYISLILGFIDHPVSRAQCGATLRENIRMHHCGSNWLGYLEQLKQRIPNRHEVKPAALSSSPIPFHALAYWLNFERARRGITDVHALIEHLLSIVMKAGVVIDDFSASGLSSILSSSVNAHSRTLAQDYYRAKRRVLLDNDYTGNPGAGDRNAALRESLAILSADWSSLADPRWRRFLAKATLGPKMTSYLRKIVRSTSRLADSPD